MMSQQQGIHYMPVGNIDGKGAKTVKMFALGKAV